MARISLIFTASALLLLLCFSPQGVQGQSTRCPNGWITWRQTRGMCYFFSYNWYTWEEARTVCRAHGGDLVTLRNQNEKIRIQAAVRRRRGRGYLIGFNQVNHKAKTAVWVDNTRWSSWHTRLWGRNEPNNRGGKEFCGHMNRYGRLNDITCNAWRGPFICRRPRNYVDKCDREKGWLPFGDRCFRMFQEPLDWRSARSSCQRNEGDLIAVTSELKLGVIKESVICRQRTEISWIGLSDTETPGQMTWVDGSAVTVKNWFPGQPRQRDSGDTCTEVVPGAGFRWRTNSCQQERKYICEKGQGSCPNGWHSWNGYCYQMNARRPQMKTFIDALNHCQAQGSILMKVTSGAEQNQVIRPFARSLKAAGVNTYWIGASDKEENGQFKWADGSKITYKRWRGRNQPRYYPNQWRCAVVLTRRRWAPWVTRYCFSKRAFLCKMKISTNLIPTTPTPTRACYDRDWVNFRDKCYFFSTYQLDWVTAQQECSAKFGANLATIDSGELQSFITVNLAGSSYIGLSNRGRDSRDLRWIANSQPVGKFKNWAMFHPVLGVPGINCVMIRGRGGRAGTWLMYNCTKQRNFICEKGASNQIIIGTTPATLPWSDLCGPGWVYDGTTDFCYQINNNAQNFFESQEACKKNQAELLSIGSKHEQLFVQKILKSKESGGGIQYWTGGNNLKPDAGWSWTDFSAFGFFNWNPGAPDSRKGANCVKIEMRLDGRWITDVCDGRYPYICKKPTDKKAVTIPYVTSPPPRDCGQGRMIAGNHFVQDAALSASSSSSPRSDATKSRIVTTSGGDNIGWQPKYNDVQQWIQVDFAVPIIVKGVVTTGKIDSDAWITSYRIIYLYDSQSDWKWYSEQADGTAKTITGNTDRTTEVIFTFKKPFQARWVRLLPVTTKGRGGLRWDIIGCIKRDCRTEPVITGDSMVPDKLLTASSIAGPFNMPQYSRLNSVRTSTNGGSWTPAFTDREPWIQADLGVIMRVRSIGTKGRDSINEWITNYQLTYSVDGTTFKPYQEPYGIDKTFTGNTNATGLVINKLKSPIAARYVRLLPKTWYGHASLRWEIYACLVGCPPIKLLSGDHAVKNKAFSASSTLNGYSNAARSRMDTVVDGNLRGGWSAAFNDSSQYIQADLGTKIFVRAIATKGRDDKDEWVTQYVIGYSFDAVEWYAYYENGSRKVFGGNSDRNSTRKNFLQAPFSARYIRLYPQASVGRISLRWEVYGCPGPLSGIHVGCYIDTKTDPDLSNTPILGPTGGMTARICIDHCYYHGYLFAGIKAGDTCRCGNKYGKHGSSKSCNIACPGNREDTCGGDYANSIYNTGLSPSFKFCPSGWLSFKDNCYLVSASKQKYQDALNICRSESADLTSIQSQAEMDFVTSVVEDKGGSWIGLNDRRLSRTYEWTDGSSVVYSNWDSGQPSNWASRGASCVLANSINGRWSGTSCDTYVKFLCEKGRQASDGPITTPVPKGCPRGWTVWDGNCYLVVFSEQTWPQAATNCKTMDSELLRIKTRQEQVYIRSQLFGKGGEYWLDLTDTKKPGTYTWSDGSTDILYTNWGRGQPDDSKGTCVAMVTNPSLGRWYDRDCGSKLKSICKRPQEGLPSMTTMLPKTPVTDPCPSGWLQYQQDCFLVVNKADPKQLLPWTSARADCRARGADLASFQSQEQLDFVWKEHIAGATTHFWIGLNSRDPNRGHTWSDFSPVTYVYWAAGEPNNVGNVEDCVEMYRNDGKWNDIRCDARRNWICKTFKGNPILDLSTTPAPLPGSRGSCGANYEEWFSFQGMCYYFSDGNKYGTKDWRHAEASCKRNNAHLVSIHSQTQLNFIKGQIKRTNKTADDYWIGLNGLDLGQGYKWADKTPVDFTAWGLNEPNDDYGNEPCIALKLATGEWHNRHCADKMGLICQRYQGAPPQPPSKPTPINGYCPSGFFKFENKCFMIVDPSLESRKTFDEARDACTSIGTSKGFNSQLATIADGREQAIITTRLMDRTNSLWIGLAQPYPGDSRRFQWLDQSPVTYTNWRAGQPDRTVLKEGNCVAMDTKPGFRSAGRWFDSFCLEKNGYICMTQVQPSIVTPSPTSNPCPRDFVSWRRSCYLLLRGSRSWTESRMYCKRTDPNAQLVSITDNYEQNFIYSLMNIDDVGNDVWIGLSDSFSPGVFTWVNNWPVTFTTWGTFQPTRSEGGCVAMGVKDGLWKDIDCNSKLPSVCKVTNDPPPTTVSPTVTGVCPPNDNGDRWVRFGRGCFLFVYSWSTYQEADTECVERDAQLASVHNQEEHEFIAATAASRRLWIGFHKTQTQGFVWRDNSPVDFVRWNNGEPNDRTGNNNENCVELWPNGNWNDLNCYDKRGYICRSPLRAERSTATLPFKTPTPANGRRTTKGFPTSWTVKTPSPTTRRPITIRTFPPWTNPPRTFPPPNPTTSRVWTFRPPTSTRRNAGPVNVEQVGVKVSSGEIAAIVILTLLLLATIVGIVMLFRHTKAKAVASTTTTTGFDNAVYSASTDSLDITNKEGADSTA